MCIYMREESAIECGFSFKAEVDIRAHGVGVKEICGSPFVGARKQCAVPWRVACTFHHWFISLASMWDNTDDIFIHLSIAAIWIAEWQRIPNKVWISVNLVWLLLLMIMGVSALYLSHDTISFLRGLFDFSFHSQFVIW